MNQLFVTNKKITIRRISLIEVTINPNAITACQMFYHRSIGRASLLYEFFHDVGPRTCLAGPLFRRGKCKYEHARVGEIVSGNIDKAKFLASAGFPLILPRCQQDSRWRE
jgi:hypothetical protein